MIQILSLREYVDKRDGKTKKAERWFENKYRSPDVETIFKNPQALLNSITPSERYNMYYTVSECLEEPGRKLLRQKHIPFDVDKLDLGTDLEVDRQKLDTIARVVCDAIGVPFEKTGVLFSGNGLQFLIRIPAPIEDVTYFDRMRVFYRAICDRVNLRLMQNSIVGEADMSVWSPARLMRFPETLNVKPGKPSRLGYILNANIEEVDFELKKASGLPDIPADQQISREMLNVLPTPDVKTIMAECKFLNWAHVHPDKVTEAEWYAALSITARFPNGKEFSHNISKGHPGYSFEETEQKLEQAHSASGARTCKNINSTSGGKCLGCKHNNTNLVSPIAIVGPDHVRTANMGFYNFFADPNTGAIRKGKPDYSGLQRTFRNEKPYFATQDGGIIWTWNGKHFEEFPKSLVEKFAEDKFDPKPDIKMRSEFFHHVRLADLRPSEWFTKSITGKMNFENGVLDVKSGILEPHSMQNGFRSVLPCVYDTTATAPRFMQFLGDITVERQELINLLQEYMGYIFANGDCRYEKILLLIGTGSNGKSTLVQVLRALAGKQGFSSLSIKDMQSDQNRYLMEGKLVNIAEENSKDSFRDTELLKNFASGGEIRVKRLYSQPYEYRNTTKLVALCNTPPASSDTTHGFYRKLLMVPFDQVFSHDKGNLDTGLIEKLMLELPGIFNWIREGYLRLEKQGRFSESKASANTLLKYQKDTDSIVAWAEDNLFFHPQEGVEYNKQEIYQNYVQFCESTGVSNKPANQVYDYIKEFIKKNGGIYHEHQRRDGQKRFRAIQFVSINPPQM